MKKMVRPWGNFKQFALNKKCTVKLLTINPHQELSLQSHKHRQENWYMLGSGEAQIGNRKFHVKEGDYIHVGKNEKHRLMAESKKLQMIEISFGKFDEKDETRYEDKYKRR